MKAKEMRQMVKNAERRERAREHKTKTCPTLEANGLKLMFHKNYKGPKIKKFIPSGDMMLGCDMMDMPIVKVSRADFDMMVKEAKKNARKTSEDRARPMGRVVEGHSKDGENNTQKVGEVGKVVGSV